MVFTKEFLIVDKNELIFILHEKNEVIATLNYSIISKSSLKMRQVAVKHSLQRKGYGKLLVELSEKKVKGMSYSKIELHARQTAVNFYKQLNYNIIEEPFYEIGILHYKMFKNV